MPLFTVKYRKRNELVKKALQIQIEADTYQDAIESFYRQYPQSSYLVTNPEEKSDEYFVGNLSYAQRETKESWLKANHISYRIGEQAYGINGDLLPNSYSPLFLQQSDIKQYDRVMKKD